MEAAAPRVPLRKADHRPGPGSRRRDGEARHRPAASGGGGGGDVRPGTGAASPFRERLARTAPGRPPLRAAVALEKPVSRASFPGHELRTVVWAESRYSSMRTIFPSTTLTTMHASIATSAPDAVVPRITCCWTKPVGVSCLR